jgi:hypothetical protein
VNRITVAKNKCGNVYYSLNIKMSKQQKPPHGSGGLLITSIPVVFSQLIAEERLNLNLVFVAGHGFHKANSVPGKEDPGGLTLNVYYGLAIASAGVSTNNKV